jgi:hypothetical protein
MGVLSLLRRIQSKLFERSETLTFAQLIKDLAGRVTTHAPQPIANGAASIIDYCVHVIWHQDIAN